MLMLLLLLYVISLDKELFLNKFFIFHMDFHLKTFILSLRIHLTNKISIL